MNIIYEAALDREGQRLKYTKMIRVLFALLCALCVSFAETRMIGEIAAKSAGQITVKADTGEAVNVPVTGDTKVLRIPPGETSLSKAASITLQDVNTGDRVLVRPNQIIVMTRSNLQEKHAADRAEWQKRGTAGKVTAIGSNSITILSGSGQTVNITTTPKTEFRRYASDSVRFSDAKPGTFTDLKLGDQVRVLGDRNGDAVTGQMIVSGTFRNFAATVVSADAATGALKLTDLTTKKPLTVTVNQDSTARRMPPMMAQMLSGRQRAAGPEGGPAMRSRAGTGAGGQGSRDIGQMLERMPALDLSELKPGDAVIVASTAGPDTSNVTAIAVVAGVEPLLTGPPTDRRLGGNWNFDINIAP